MGVRYYLNRRSKADRRETGVVLAALRGNTQIRVMTPIRVKPSDWADKQQRVRSSVPGATELNGALARLKADAERMLLDYPDDGDLRDALRARLGKNASGVGGDILALYARFLDAKRARCKEKTVRTYEDLQKHLQRFVADREASVGAIGSDWLDAFASYLVARGLQNSTSNLMLSRTKGFLRWLVDRRELDRVPEAVPLPTASNFALYLSADELARLASLDLADATPGVRATRDLFVFAAVTGQRYSDLQGMRWEDLRPQERPETWHLYVKKTDSTLPVPLSSPAREIIEARRGQRTPLPQISNQKANNYIKTLCERAGISEPVTLHKMRGGVRETETMPKHEAVTTHVARKTFITLALQSGLSMNELLGFTHRDLTTLKVYAGQDHSRLRAALHGVFDGLAPSLRTPEGSDGTGGSEGSEGN